MTEKIKIPSYYDVIGKDCSHFLQELNEREVMENADGSRIVEYILNSDSGGEFLISDTINNKSGILFVYGNDVYNNKLYIINEKTKEITPVDCNNLEDFKKRYKIFYKDKKQLDKLQPVSIEDENNIQTDKGVVLSFYKIDSNNPNSKLYLCGIYNGEFKEVIEEVIDPETSKKTTQTRKLLTGNANIFYQNGNINIQGSLENGLFKQGKLYIKDGTLRQEGTFIENEEGLTGLNGENCKKYYPITIQQGEFRNNGLYSGSAYLRENPTSKTIEQLNNEQINPNKKIYTLERDEKNSNIRILTFCGNVIGLDRDIVINIYKNNIATLQTIDGKPTKLTKEEINKIKDFFNNIPKEQLVGFDKYFITLYYTAIMNKEIYKDINILIPDICEYYFKTSKEVEQTINLINKIPQEKRNGKYIIPCDWLKYKHQVNLIIDFDNKICEIVNTGDNVDLDVIDNLQQELRSNFKGENWIVYENNIVQQSTGNCVVASNIVATEKVMLEERVKEYFKKKENLKKLENEILNLSRRKPSKKQSKQQIELSKQAKQKEKEELEEEIQQYLNLMVSDDEKTKIIGLKDLEKNIKSFSKMYDNQIRKITTTEQEKLITTNLLLKERLLLNESVNNQFDEQMTNIVISNKKAIII